MRAVTGIANWLTRVTAPPPPVLGQYHVPRAPARDRLFKLVIYSLIAFVGLFYGLMVAIFPMFLYLYMATPILLLAMVLVWALPQSDKVPEGAMEGLFWAYLVSMLLWPNYLAISLPGLPWITVQRLVLFPLAFLLMISFSISPAYRARTAEVFRDNPWMSRLLLAFWAIQFITIAFSKTPADSLNRFVSNTFLWTMLYTLAVIIFQKNGRGEKLVYRLLMMLVILGVVAIFEFRNQGVLWANHIPSFLKVADESVQRTLAGGIGAHGSHRVLTTFSTPLGFAEILGLSTGFLVYAIISAKSAWQRALLILYFPAHFMAIWSTSSRLGMVGFFGSCLAYLFIWGVHKWNSRPNAILPPMLVLGYPAILGTFLALSFIWHRLEVLIWGGGSQQASTEGRKLQWAAFWPKFFAWPFGHGPGSSGDALGYANRGGVTTVDSYYITIAMDYGIFGFISFYGLIAVAMYTAFALAIQKKQENMELMAPAAVLLGMFIVIKGVFSQEGGNPLVFVVLGLIAVANHQNKNANFRLSK